jgi:cysteine-S-conjugate beta-lyase
MKFDFDKKVDMKGINSEKWNNGKNDNLISMWIADMDFETVPEIKKAIRDRSETGIFGYTDTPEGYYASLSGWFEKRHCWKIDKEWVTHSSGVINALHIALKSVAEKDDGVVIQPPVYHPFYRVITRCGMRTILNPLRIHDGRYVPDFDDLESKLKKEKPKAFILCNPHNPTGKVYAQDELRKIGELCIKYGVTVISDEIHCDLTYGGHRHIPFASISEEFQNNSIICTAPSKTFNLAGLYTSNIIIPDTGLRKKFSAVCEEIGLHPVNIFGMVACEAGYKFGGEWLDGLLEYLQQNRDYALSFVRDKLPEIGVTEPEGTYFLWMNFRSLGLANGELENLLLEKAGLRLNQGYIFGREEGSGFVRMNMACRRSVLKEAFERLEKAVRTL